MRPGSLRPGAGVRKVFCGQVRGAVEAVWSRGPLLLPAPLADEGVRRVLVKVARQQWNSRMAERYPPGRGVAQYLARDVRGGPLTDHRCVALAGQQVTFRYGNHRELAERGTPRHQELTRTVTEFLRRGSEHVPRPGVQMVRAWGLYASTQRPKRAQGREQLPAGEAAQESAGRRTDSNPDRDHLWERGPVCRQQRVVTPVLARSGAPPPPCPLAEAA